MIRKYAFHLILAGHFFHQSEQVQRLHSLSFLKPPDPFFLFFSESMQSVATLVLLRCMMADLGPKLKILSTSFLAASHSVLVTMKPPFNFLSNLWIQDGNHWTNRLLQSESSSTLSRLALSFLCFLFPLILLLFCWLSSAGLVVVYRSFLVWNFPVFRMPMLEFA